jgi:hypothetical protein
VTNTNGQAYALRVLCPVEPARVDALRDLLTRLGTGEGSPFATGTTHFGRLVVITAIDGHGRGTPSPEDLSCPYLLVSCTFDGHDPRAYLQSVFDRAGPGLIDVFSHCIGFPGRPANGPGGGPGPGGASGGDSGPAIEYLLHNQLAVDLFYSAYPNSSVAAVRSALELRQRFIGFAVASQTKPAAALMADFRAQFPDLIP